MEAYPELLLIPATCWQDALAHALACLPEEACGLFGGMISAPAGGMTQASVVEVIRVENELHSPVRFRMAAQEQLKAFLRFEERGLELVGLFHSHPAGPVHPSPTDLAEFAYPGVLTVILAPGERARPAGAAAFLPRAYAIDGVLSAAAHFTEVPITLLPAG